jgi:hypothetical protein
MIDGAEAAATQRLREGSGIGLSMLRMNWVSAGPSVGSTLRAITRPLSSRTDATVLAWVRHTWWSLS